MAAMAEFMEGSAFAQPPGRPGVQRTACLPMLRAEHPERALVCAGLLGPRRQLLQRTEHAERTSVRSGRLRRDRGCSGRRQPRDPAAAAVAGAGGSKPGHAHSKAAALRSLIRSPEIVEVQSACSAQATHSSACLTAGGKHPVLRGAS